MQQSQNIQPDGGGATGEPLAAELADYLGQFERIKQETRELLDGLTEAQFNWRDVPGRWSIGECLSHLNVTGNAYLSQIDEQIGRARANGVTGRGPFRHGFLGNWFVRLTEPPVKMKVKNPKVLAPVPDQQMASVTSEFATLQEELIARLHAANGLHLARIKIPSPVSKYLKLTLGQCFALITAHERRHLWQAQQMKANVGAETETGKS